MAYLMSQFIGERELIPVTH